MSIKRADSSTTLALSKEQCRALAELDADVVVEKTFSDTGGEHLYAMCGAFEYHIAKDGTVHDVG